ncbi:hypothetical protein VTJ04DRAFT_4630 [Mycothermus thermophilus]|uniref:uncharacterized protein n=1 Tax=Humicola insolens TaxID=85995 RepID=UPI00374399B6
MTTPPNVSWPLRSSSRVQLSQSSNWKTLGRATSIAHFSNTPCRQIRPRKSILAQDPSSESSDSKSKKRPSTIYDDLFRQIPRASSKAQTQDTKKTNKPSLYQLLVAETLAGIPGQNVLPRDELRRWLGEDVKRRSPEPKEPSSPPNPDQELKILVLNHMPRSLIESDFYRYAPQGKHLAGWAGGIVKVAQSISPVTREPRGQYFVFFESEQHAKAYKQHLESLPRLDMDSSNSNNNSTMPEPTTNSSSLPLLPTLNYISSPTLLSTAQLIGMLTPHYNPSQPVHPSAFLRSTSKYPHGLLSFTKHQQKQPIAADSPREQPPSNPADDDSGAGAGAAAGGAPVLLKLSGTKLPLSTLTQLIHDDGVERNLPWQLIEHRPEDPSWPEPVRTLKAGSGPLNSVEEDALLEGEDRAREEGDGGKEDGKVEVYGFTRFVVTLADVAEARRFVRSWNGKELGDAEKGWWGRVGATVFW